MSRVFPYLFLTSLSGLRKSYQLPFSSLAGMVHRSAQFPTSGRRRSALFPTSKWLMYVEITSIDWTKTLNYVEITSFDWTKTMKYVEVNEPEVK